MIDQFYTKNCACPEWDRRFLIRDCSNDFSRYSPIYSYHTNKFITTIILINPANILQIVMRFPCGIMSTIPSFQ